MEAKSIERRQRCGGSLFNDIYDDVACLACGWRRPDDSQSLKVRRGSGPKPRRRPVQRRDWVRHRRG